MFPIKVISQFDTKSDHTWPLYSRRQQRPCQEVDHGRVGENLRMRGEEGKELPVCFLALNATMEVPTEADMVTLGRSRVRRRYLPLGRPLPLLS